MKRNYDLTPFSGFDGFLNGIIDFERPISSFFTNPFKFDLDTYSLKENKDGNKYEVTVRYNDDYDNVSVKVDEKKKRLIITIYNDFDKSDIICSCSYYGKYIMDIPEDCVVDTMNKTIDKDKETITISFEKEKKEEKSEEKTDTCKKDCEDKPEEEETVYIIDEDDEKKESEPVDYHSLYDNLWEKYNNEVNEYEHRVDMLEEKIGRLRDEKDVLEKKLKRIMDCFE